MRDASAVSEEGPSMSLMGPTRMARENRALASTDLTNPLREPSADGPLAVQEPKQQDLRARASKEQGPNR